MKFSDYYASKVTPILEKQLAQMPEAAREPIRAATRAQMAECWNAALDAAIFHGWEGPASKWLPDRLEKLKVQIS
jgi:hypothetical protein